MRSIKEVVIERAFLLSAIASGSITLLILAFMLLMAFPLMKEGQFFRLLATPWEPGRAYYGIYPMLISTLGISFLSLILAFPVSLGCAGYITVIGPRRLRPFLRRVIQTMTGIPTVIYGFVGIFLLVPLIREYLGGNSGMCILSASLMLAILISPTMILFFSDSFERVPGAFLDAADGLGATSVQKFLYVMFPAAAKGMIIGLILAFGRAMGDTLIALMIAGNAAQIPGSLFDSARTLTAHIALVIAADYESMEFKSIFACGILLYILTAVIVASVRCLLIYGKRVRP